MKYVMFLLGVVLFSLMLMVGFFWLFEVSGIPPYVEPSTPSEPARLPHMLPPRGVIPGLGF